MTHTRLGRWVGWLGLLLIPWATARGDSLETALVSPYPQALDTGHLIVERDNWQSFVVGSDFDPTTPPGPVSAWIETAAGSGDFFDLGSLYFVDDHGWPAGLLVLEAPGAPDPTLGVADIDDLSGRVIQVRDANHVSVALQGAVPLGSKQQSDLGGVLPVGRIDLQRPVFGPATYASGTVAIGQQGPTQMISIATRRLSGYSWDPFSQQLFTVWLEQTPGGADFARIGALANLTRGDYGDNGLRSIWEYKLRASGTAPAPLGVAHIAALAGRRLEIRNEGNALLLQTVFPLLSSDPQRVVQKAKTSLSLPPGLPPSPNARGQLSWTYDRSLGRSTFAIQIKGLAVPTLSELWIESAPGSGVFLDSGTLASTGNGTSAVGKAATKYGDWLPLGVPRVIDLSGRRVQVRSSNGIIQLVGAVP